MLDYCIQEWALDVIKNPRRYAAAYSLDPQPISNYIPFTPYGQGIETMIPWLALS